MKLVTGWRTLKNALRDSLFRPSVSVSTLFTTVAPPFSVHPVPLPPKPRIVTAGDTRAKKALAGALSRKPNLVAIALTVVVLVSMNGAVYKVEVTVGVDPSRVK